MYYIGERFGRLTVISHHHKQNTRHFVVCRCDCGRLKIVSTSDLKSHRTFSCGCLSRELREERKKNKIKNENLRYIWVGMRQRCNNPNNKSYKNYGARGIRVCAEWDTKKSFRTFEAWALKNGYRRGLSLDRIDNDGNYEPANCRWADAVTQANNKRGTIKINYNGNMLSVTEANNLLGFPKNLLYRRLYSGWPIDRALTEPVHVEYQKKRRRYK